jgi:fructan beta-fructosidase
MTLDWRPAFHFTPRRNWMNDPNGLVRFNGAYHLFFQYNPGGDQWGEMSWGHATSPDLVRWTELPVALRATAEEAYFSGSAVVDGAGLVAALTIADPAGRQTQAVARSADGSAWTVGPERLTDPDPDFRDPKLIRDGDGWLLVVALSAQRRVRFYRSADLRDWTAVGEFGPAGAVGGVWEMPDLLRLPVDGVPRYVLVVGVTAGGPGGGSATQFFVGDFDGRTFTATDSGWADLGPDFYAAASFAGLAGRTVWLAWLNDWRYAAAVPTAPWRGILTVPREVSLRTIDGRVRLVQRPVPELAALRGRPVTVAEQPLAGEAVLPVRGAALELLAEFAVAPGGAAGLVVRRSADGREGTRIGWSDGRLELDRTRSGTVDLHPDFAAGYAGPLPARDGRVTIRVLVDHCSVEVFGGVGEITLSGQVFPAGDSDRVSAYGRNARLERLTAWPVTATIQAGSASQPA